jgi:hypothetical protein
MASRQPTYLEHLIQIKCLDGHDNVERRQQANEGQLAKELPSVESLQRIVN